jgi:RNA polymerase sigma-70 factor (ECF subfamily)
VEFEQIYQAYFKPVYLYAMQLSGSEHVAEEITAETFYKAIRAIDSFRGDCEMRVWLCQIAKNTYYSYLKKHKKECGVAETELQNIADPDAVLGERIENQEEARQIRKILHTLSDPYKEVFLWRALGELSFQEIGGLYGKTDNWACVTYHRARKMIQSRLEESEHEP